LAGVGAALSLGFCSGMQAAEHDEPATLPIIAVRVDNVAGVRPADLQFAERRASDVFARIGVGVCWIDASTAISAQVAPPFAIVIVNAEGTAIEASRFFDALGLAHPSVHRAHVFYDRVAALNVGTPRTIPSLLGDVLAHELGHLLLPPPGHSLDGIMRPGLETKSWDVRTFTKAQAHEVVSRVRALP
jgi:hypothetical protein